MRYDDILEEVGQFGPYQRRILFLLCIPGMVMAMANLSVIFTLTEPEHRCAIPGYKNDTFKIESDYQGELEKAAIVPKSSCLVYSDFNISNPFTVNGSRNASRPTEKCHHWVYDQSETYSSIITEFDLVCDMTYMRATSNMGLYGGSFIGSFIFGLLADMLGRKRSLILATSMSGVTTLVLSFMPNVISIVVMRFIQGMSFRVFAISFSTVVEIVGPDWRTTMGMGSVFGYVVGEFLLIPLAYLARDWRLIYLILGCLTFAGLIAVFFTPESPRWLLDNGRFKEAEVVIQRIADSNKRTMPRISKDTLDDDKGPQLRIWEMFKYKRLVIRTLIIIYMWFGVNLMYTGLTLNLDNLPGNTYFNFFLGLVVETIGNFMVFFSADRLGRTRVLTISVFTGGASCLLVILPVMYLPAQYSWVITALAMVGRLAASAWYGTIYILTSELFPTVVRNSGIAFCAIFENIAAMISPYVADSGKLVGGPLAAGLPMLVFGGVALLAGALSTQLPETLGKPLPDTIDDALAFGKKEDKQTRNETEMKPTRL